MNLFKTKHFSFSAIYFFGWGAYATFALDFLYYSGKIGFTNTEIGLIYGSKVLLGILFQPLFGLICDYIRSTRKLLLIMSVAAIFLSAGIPLVSSKLSVLVLIFTYTFSVSAFMPLLDNWVASECINEERSHFGALRLWGSLGYAVIAIIYGRMTMYVDIANIFYGRAILFVIVILLVYFNQHETHAAPKTEEKEKPDVKALFSKKEYWLFFIFIFIFCFPIYASNTFFPKLLVEIGSTNQTIAFFSSFNAIVEIPFFLYVRKLSKKIGSRGLILVGCLFSTIRLIGFSFAGSVPLLLAAYLCAAPYVSFFMPGMIYYSYSIAPNNTKAFTLTTLQGFAMGLTGMLGSYIGGLIIDSKGIQPMYAYYSIVCIAGIALFLATSWWLKRGNSHVR